MTDTNPYTLLCERLGEIATLGSVGALVAWDQETYMPSKGAPGRAKQAAALASLIHQKSTHRGLGELIGECEALGLDESSPEAANVARARRDFDKRTKLPESLVNEIAETQSRAQHAWKSARKNSDFKAFQPWLEKMVALSRKKAECFGVPEGGELYDALIDEYEPDVRAAEIEAVFTPLRDRLTTLVARLLDKGTPPNEAPLRIEAAEAAQHALGMEVIQALGFDTEAGRLDITTHPFCEGLAPGDTRLTTRYDTKFFAGALFGTMHECGHGLYEQGLPKIDSDGEPSATFGTPLAEAVSLGIHESQSRMWENFLGRSREFWTWAKPVADRHFGQPMQAFSVDEVYRAVNRVERSFIRVEADEATYNLHVMLRFELERALISGDLAVADLPGVWNETFERFLGSKVDADRNGCLQDVHWSFGLFGYFPTYTLGNLYAAQFWEAIREKYPDLDERLAAGDFTPVLAWNREYIHRHGRRFGAAELCERATGRPLSPDPLIKHLERKFIPIYDA